MLGDFLYGLQPQEAASAPVLQRFADRRSVTGAAAALSIEWRVPKDRVFLLQHIGGVAATAGVAIVQDMEARIRDLALNTVHFVFNLLGGAGTFFLSTPPPWYPLVVMAEERIFVEVNFDAALAGNILDVSMIGVLLPRGTLQFGALERL